MTHGSGRGVVRVLSTLILFGALTALAADPPDSRINPQSGAIETVDTTPSGGASGVRHTTTASSGQPRLVVQLTNPTVDDNAPRIAISTAGETWVTWWRSSTPSQVFARSRSYGSGTWATERRISVASEDSRSPEIAHDGSTAWIAYEIPGTNVTSIAVAGGTDNPDPWTARLVLATTGFSGDPDTTIDVVSGHLWVTWVDSTTQVGWCEYDYAAQSWSAPSYVSYASDSVNDARERIRTAVLGS